MNCSSAQPADHGLADAAAVFVVEFDLAGEPHGVESFAEARERTRVVVVRRGRQEQAVLEPGGDPLEHLRDVGVGAERRGGEVVGLVYDQQVPLEGAVFAGLDGTPAW